MIETGKGSFTKIPIPVLLLGLPSLRVEFLSLSQRKSFGVHQLFLMALVM
jgi:hypothetical protein